MTEVHEKTKFNIVTSKLAMAQIDRFWRENEFKNRNEFILRAIEFYIEQFKRRKLEQELKKGYMENAKTAIKESAVWESINYENWRE